MTAPGTRPANRRQEIAGCVISLAANGGARAVTHSAIDRELHYPKGSTSYYFRTRAELIDAAAEQMQKHSRASFTEMIAQTAQTAPGALAAADRAAMATLIASYLEHLMTERSAEVKARLALTPELQPGRLRELFFSTAAATELFAALRATHPEALAAGLIGLLEGILLRTTTGRDPSSHDDDLIAISAYLRGSITTD